MLSLFYGITALHDDENIFSWVIKGQIRKKLLKQNNVPHSLVLWFLTKQYFSRVKCFNCYVIEL